MMTAFAWVAAYIAAGLFVSWKEDANRHYAAERITAYNPAKARRMCQYGWITDVIIWPLHALAFFGAVVGQAVLWVRR